jgi:hypothetical protein
MERLLEKHRSAALNKRLHATRLVGERVESEKDNRRARGLLILSVMMQIGAPSYRGEE